jgi:RimJ/RimL family protein N-acetyltransferase
VEPVYLRALEIDDLERTHRWHNDPSLYQTLVGPFRYVSLPAEEAWLRQKQAFSHQEVNLAICLPADSRHVGNIYLREIDWIARHAEVSMFIAEAEERSKGYGTAALRLAIQHAFGDLGLLRLYAFVLEENEPIRRVLDRCSFVVEGKLRRHAFKHGALKDVLIAGLCREDWPQGE